MHHDTLNHNVNTNEDKLVATVSWRDLEDTIDFDYECTLRFERNPEFDILSLVESIYSP